MVSPVSIHTLLTSTPSRTMLNKNSRRQPQAKNFSSEGAENTVKMCHLTHITVKRTHLVDTSFFFLVCLKKGGL